MILRLMKLDHSYESHEIELTYLRDDYPFDSYDHLSTGEQRKAKPR